MNETSRNHKLRLDQILSRREGRALELKEARDGFSLGKIYRYVVALANGGVGDLVLGVKENRQGPPHEVVGTTAFRDPVSLTERVREKVQIHVIIEELSHPSGRVLAITIPGRPRGQAHQLEGAFLIRQGEALVSMTSEKLREVLTESDPRPEEAWVMMGLSGSEVHELLDTSAQYVSVRAAPPSKDAQLRKLAHAGGLIGVERNYAITAAGVRRSRFCSVVYARAFALAWVLWWFVSYSVGVR